MIRVISATDKNSLKEKDVEFYLRQDNWNDHSYQTQYHLFLSGAYSLDGEPVLIGDVKILKKGQTSSDRHLLTIGEIDTLNDDFCSLGQSLDYYERLANIEPEIRNYIFKALNDVVINPSIKNSFKKEDGWNISVMRYIDENDDIFILPPIMISKDYQKLPSIDLSFKFNNKSLNNPIEFNFDSPSYGYGHKLPSRLIVLVGRNGSGKSTLLSKISRVAFASGVDRRDPTLKEIGEFEPAGLGFPKIINISYSAFDSFQVPGIYIDEKEQILKDIKNSQGRYIFCGIRDICKELESSINSIERDSRGKLTKDEILKDRQSFTQLKSIEDLLFEVKTLLEKIKGTDREKILYKVFNILSKESSFKDLSQLINKNELVSSLCDIFSNSSTGHKFVIHSLVNIIAHSEKRSLILFDEPETHLHPPLLAVLMSSIRFVLDELDAFSIIATHSPVVVQETLSRHVNIIRRKGELTKIITPEIQTYGENIASITSHVFSLSSEVTDFHNELDEILSANKFGFFAGGKSDLLEKCEDLFDGEMSMQATAYIMSMLAKRDS
ncbi:AAA family ATPase [Vibrio splendidus]|uniref:AAA family ATPase n=1 Tax=Vibrio splendidus TaxID=29497 RepID=UPI0024689071|nr:AAA family ATPase [Vibrio splendidus]MDH6016130.1 AAA family ATPase [Vibrio splendidus]